MAFTTADLASIDAALTSGELSVEVQGRRVVYRSVDELIKARATVDTLLKAQSASTKPVRTAHFTFATQRERY